MAQYTIEDIPALEPQGQVMRECMGCGVVGPATAVAVPGDPEPARKTFVYCLCGNCGTLSLTEPPANIAEYYPDDYYSFSVRNSSSFRSFARRARNAMTLFDSTPFSNVSAGLASNRSFLSLRPLFNGVLGKIYRRTDAILDVGCGDGQKLYDMRELGFSNLTGVDPFMRSPCSSPGFDLRRAWLDDIEGPFDVVIFHHSMEHMTDPAKALRTVARLLRVGGVLVVRIPLVGGWAWRAYGGEWAQLDAPRHMHLFSQQGFGALAKRTGWRIAHTLYDSGALQFAGSKLRLMGGNFHKHPEELRTRFSRAELRDFERQAARLNEESDGDMATFFLFSASR